ncbi:MAG: HPr(Ser) kinase/phosphatase [Eubacterium sp.]|nr:HPr(Ser) kinase/phosphatase [Eubacterium sp.]MBQ7201435.1 HPr(Ser) kinase/phosphatase [Eubacterium sp.]MBR0119929.1 HPr(Ser) kinase/phosphatase [Eubacterium sp.]
MDTVSIKKFVDHMECKALTCEDKLSDIKITQSDINRPALQLAGFFDYFDHHRVQIIGQVEYTYMEKQGIGKSAEMMERIMSYKVPCIVFCRDIPVQQEFIDLSEKFGVPILSTAESTSSFSAEVTRWLHVELAPMISIHGVLVDIFGEGVLITGESGIGKSEVALELIHRGHRLVTDDVVEIRKVSDETLIGQAPDITRHFIELRGIGIIDAKTLFGIESVKDTMSVDLVLHLEEWNKDREYDRMGLEDNYTEFLGNKVPIHYIPIRPGRNGAIICESAAVNFRQKKMGYNAAAELYRRISNNMGGNFSE